MPPKTLQFRDFSGGINRTAARTGMKDNQVFMAENAQPIGPGILQTLRGPGASIATISQGIATMWDGTLTIAGISTPLLLTINTDGSISQINPATSVVTVVAAASTVTPAARVAPWQDTPLLIVDPVKGYFTWDGTTFTVRDATKLARDVTTFEGRAFLLTGQRTTTFTAPASFTDFTVASGAGSAIVTDSVFIGSVRRMLSALELLWLVGPGAVNAISNLQVTGSAPVVTTFSNTNIVASVGSVFPSSVASFFRTFIFLTPYGVYAIVGATPQKLSENLDGLFPLLSLGTDAPAAVFSLNNIFVWGVLVTYADPVLGNRPILLCFARGSWFVANQGTTAASLTWVTSLVRSGIPGLWGTDGTHIFQCFQAPTGTYTVSTKLWDFGAFTTQKQLLRFALEFSSDSPVTATVTLENGIGNQASGAGVTPLNTLTFTGAGGAVITFVGSGAITWISAGLATMKSFADFSGTYLGMTIAGTSAPFTLDALAMEVLPQGEWTL